MVPRRASTSRDRVDLPLTHSPPDQVRRFTRTHKRRINHQALRPPSLVVMPKHSLPAWQRKARNVGFPALHAPAVFRNVRADDLNLHQMRRRLRRHGPPRLTRDRQRVDAIGDHGHVECEVGLGQLVGHDVARWAHVFSAPARSFQRVLDGVDTQVGGRTRATSCRTK